MYKKISKKSEDLRASDATLRAIILNLQSVITSWAQSKDIWYECGFQSYALRIDGDPHGLPIVTILYFSSDFESMLEGYTHGLDEEFRALLHDLGFCYEQADVCSLHIYPLDDRTDLVKGFADLARWQWICSLIQPDVSDVSEELYSYFAKNSHELTSLNWRDFEIILSKIFQANGFQTELGPGRGDFGVDLSLLQRDPLGDMLTLVQAKKYNPKHKIKVEAVQALYGVTMAENAHQGMFVTTSSYLPSTKSWAGRTSGKITLHTSEDIAQWCLQASAGIIEDKSTLVSPSVILRTINEVSSKPNNKVLYSTYGYNMQINRFALVLKETKHAALLMRLPAKTISDDGYGQKGREIPLLDESAIEGLKSDTVWRAKRIVSDGSVQYWDGDKSYWAWDGSPRYFDYCD